MKAPTPVRRVEIPSQNNPPITPALVKVRIDKKNTIFPITTFGCPSGVLNFETSRPKVKKVNDKKTLVQERYCIKKSFNCTRTRPCLEKETMINPESAKKSI